MTILDISFAVSTACAAVVAMIGVGIALDRPLIPKHIEIRTPAKRRYDRRRQRMARCRDHITQMEQECEVKDELGELVWRLDTTSYPHGYASSTSLHDSANCQACGRMMAQHRPGETHVFTLSSAQDSSVEAEVESALGRTGCSLSSWRTGTAPSELTAGNQSGSMCSSATRGAKCSKLRS